MKKWKTLGKKNSIPSSKIPVAMSPHGWKVNSAIFLGSAHYVPCTNWCIWCCLDKAVLSRISKQRLHLDCCPSPDQTLFDLFIIKISWLQGHRQTDQMITQGLHKTVSENWQILTTQNSTFPGHCLYEKETYNSSNLEVLDNLDCSVALEDEFGVYQLQTTILYTNLANC